MTNDGKSFIEYVASMPNFKGLQTFTSCIRKCLKCEHFKYDAKSTSYWHRAKCCYCSGHGFSLYRTSHRDAEQLGCPKECPLISIEDRKRMIDDIEIKLKYNKIIALQDEIARNKKQLDELWQEIIEADKDK